MASPLNRAQVERASPLKLQTNLVTAKSACSSVGQQALVSASTKDQFLQAIQASNIFSSANEKDKVMRMARLAKFTYEDDKNFAEVSASFPFGLALLPTAEKVGVALPHGLKVQAFRHKDEVIIAVRGTELTKDFSTTIANLIADLGIGRHKSNEDLLSSVSRVENHTSELYDFEINQRQMELLENVIQTRVLGHNNIERLSSMGSRIAVASAKGALKGSFIGGIVSTVATGTAVALGLTNPLTAFALIGLAAFSSASTGAGTSAIIETVKCGTVMDGYETLLANIKAIDAYIMQLKQLGYITENDEFITLGHSKGGYEASVIGAMHADEIYSFNGPGLKFDVEMRELIANTGLKRQVQPLVEYHSYIMKGDFIGNLGARDGALHHLSIPIILKETIEDFPTCHYNSLLAHHGIDLILGVLANSSVLTLPRNLSEGPKIELLDDDEEEAQAKA